MKILFTSIALAGALFVLAVTLGVGHCMLETPPYWNEPLERFNFCMGIGY